MGIIEYIKRFFAYKKSKPLSRRDSQMESIIEEQRREYNKIVSNIDKMYDVMLKRNDKISENAPEDNPILVNDRNVIESLKRQNQDPKTKG